MAVDINFTDLTPEQWNAAFWRARPPQCRVFATMNDIAQRQKKANELAAQGFLIDYQIDVQRTYGTPYETTHQRLMVGVVAVAAGPGTEFPDDVERPFFPCPPSLEPWPDPPVKKDNEFVGDLLRVVGGIEYYAPAAGDRGLSMPPGAPDFTDNDGHVYRRLDPIEVGDPLLIYKKIR